MTIGGAFAGGVIGAAVNSEYTAPVTVWYLSGGVSAANCLQAYLAKGAADIATSYVNLANVGVYTLTATSAPTFNTATGWTFNGSANYLLVGGGTGPTLKPFSIIARITLDGTAAYRCMAGGAGGSVHYRISNGHKQQVLKGNVAQILESTNTVPSSDAVVACTYSAVGACVVYLNGTPDGTATNDQTITADNEYVGQGDNTHFFKGIMAGIAIYNIVLDGTQVAAIGSALAAL